MGFTAVSRHRSKNVLRFAQGDINFILNMEPVGPAGRRSAQSHGPSANAMAFRVEDAAKALKLAVERGAKPVQRPGRADGAEHPGHRGDRRLEPLSGRPLRRAGDLRRRLRARFPGAPKPATGVGLTYLDHLTHNVHRGQMAHWAEFYERIFNFREIRYFDIEGQQTGLLSKAMTSPCGKIRIPLNESRDEHSQIEEFLRDYHGEGIQHIALGTRTTSSTPVETMRGRGRDVPGHARHLLRARSTPACRATARACSACAPTASWSTARRPRARACCCRSSPRT